MFSSQEMKFSVGVRRKLLDALQHMMPGDIGASRPKSALECGTVRGASTGFGSMADGVNSDASISGGMGLSCTSNTFSLMGGSSGTGGSAFGFM